MPDLASLRARNAARWANAKLTRASEFGPVAARLAAPAAKARYQAIEAKTGVPWFFIAVVHQRESSQDWSRSLAQGDPWNKKSTHVPKGRGPFASFEDAAVDALTNCAPYAARNTDWSIGGLLTLLEQYNGLGYFNRGLPSPYVWSGTDQYIKGKYVADGKFDPNVVDKQLGCAGLILAMMQIDSSIKLETVEGPAGVAMKPPAESPTPSPVNPAKGSLGALIAGFIASIFNRAA
ncbi:lysozyme family protein [Nitrobacteraceae bacterium AZCC 1564]